ncbi:MAG: hypothetical protein WCG20_00915 [bacterium]
MITNEDYKKLQEMLKATIKEELKTSWELHSKDFQEFVVDHLQKLYEGQEKLIVQVENIHLRLKMRKKYD